MNSSIRRWATLRSAASTASTFPSSSSTSSFSGRSKSIEPRRRRRPLRTLNSSPISSNRGTRGRYFSIVAASRVGQNRVHVGVRHPLVAVNDAVVQLVADDVAAGVDFHQAGLHEAIDVRVQTAQSGRELAREHVHGALREVHRGPAIAGLAIQRTALRHVVRHVRDVDTQPVVAVRQPIDGDRVVEVPGVLAVDRDRLDVPEIGPAGEVLVSHRRPEADRLRHGLLAVCLRNPVLAENHAEVHTGRLDVAEHLDDAAGRVARRRRKSRDLDRDHLTRLRPARIAGDHLDVHEQLAIEGHDIAQARPVEHITPHHRRRVALEDLDDAALGTTAFPHTLQSRRRRGRRASPPEGCRRRCRCPPSRRRAGARVGRTHSPAHSCRCGRPRDACGREGPRGGRGSR